MSHSLPNLAGWRTAAPCLTNQAHYRHTLKAHSFSFLTQRKYSCSNFVVISSLVLELLKKCRVRQRVGHSVFASKNRKFSETIIVGSYAGTCSFYKEAKLQNQTLYQVRDNNIRNVKIDMLMIYKNNWEIFIHVSFQHISTDELSCFLFFGMWRKKSILPLILIHKAIK